MTGTKNACQAFTRAGVLQGEIVDGTCVYRGVPYAKPPVGNLRFAPPAPLDASDDVIDCTVFGHCAVQEPSMLVNTEPSEDCLYLNVWAPENVASDAKLPVFVWIHGGGYYNGCGSMNYYDGTEFVKQGVIVVTINYRLGALGFFALQTLLDEYGTTGNWGTLDQIAALQWVQDNIAAFGGDPNAVTIAGESAGSFSVSSLVLSPRAKGLFRYAIMESGSLFNDPAAVVHTKAQLEPSIRCSREIAAQFGADDSPAGLEKLRGIDAKELWDAGFFSSDITVDAPHALWHTLDGAVIPTDPVAAIESGDINGEAFIIGYNVAEGAVFVGAQATPEGALAYMDTVFTPQQRKQIDALYPEDINPLQQVVDVVTYLYFKAGMSFIQDALVKRGKKVYAYQFEHTPEGTYPMSMLGAHHAVEIPYVFATYESVGLKPGEHDRMVEQQMNGMWSSFVKTGDPNTPDVPSDVTWTPYASPCGPCFGFGAHMHCGEIDDAEKIALYRSILIGK